jgi:hypothetical protein
MWRTKLEQRTTCGEKKRHTDKWSQQEQEHQQFQLQQEQHHKKTVSATTAFDVSSLCIIRFFSLKSHEYTTRPKLHPQAGNWSCGWLGP